MREESNDHPSPRDLERLVLYLERFPMVAVTSFRSCAASLRYQFLWDRFAAHVNPRDKSMKKSGKEWCKYWSKWRRDICRKYSDHQRYLAAGEESPIEFRPHEQRLLKLLTDNQGNLLTPTHSQRRLLYSGMNNNNIDFEREKAGVQPQKTMEEPRKESVEFELKKQKELNMAKQKIVKHDMDMAILELRKKFLANEFD